MSKLTVFKNASLNKNEQENIQGQFFGFWGGSYRGSFHYNGNTGYGSTGSPQPVSYTGSTSSYGTASYGSTGSTKTVNYNGSTGSTKTANYNGSTKTVNYNGSKGYFGSNCFGFFCGWGC